ncbi:hypothetical protein J2I47_12645 [Fibrella sp. HMF5335]|uniref:Uncharacterized protein n=1 Tax=Fibrella rubiginis TaxID=2817060 RepID=A0A939GFI8_9BACT|nr:hypothetical protein [Fibrella rubiginis]MBO0937396.1 hypothetical protein [Fibrella rubiginis]
MRAGSFFVRTWRILSILGFVGSLYSNYISFPVDVAVRFNSLGQAVQYVGRETIFYLSIGIFLLVYVITNAVARLFPKLPTERIPNPNPAKWVGYRQELVAIYVNWFYALAAAFNTILGLGLMVLSFLNRSDRTNVGPSDYTWLLPLSTFILAAVVVSLPIRLLMKPPVEYVP